MGRKKLEIQPVRRLVYFDPEIWEALEFLYYNKLLGKMERNTVNNIVNKALREQLKDVILLVRESKQEEVSHG